MAHASSLGNFKKYFEVAQVLILVCLEVDDLILTKMSPTQDTNGMKLWQCNDCGYTRERKSDVKRHIEYKHVDLQVS